MTFRGIAVKSSHHIETMRHAITHSALSPVIHVESPERVGWYEPGVMVIRLPALPPEPETTDSGLYTDLQTAQAVAEQMRQLIDVYRLLYGEFYARPQPRN
jgi:hypothetical protein